MSCRYLDQLDFQNGKDVQTLESRVEVMGDDLNLVKHVEGQFFERFELQPFPFDSQDLTVTLVSQCASSGPVPCELVLGRSAHLGVDVATFAFADQWALSPTITAQMTTTHLGATERRFPCLHLRAVVSRRPAFIILNVFLPTMVITALSSVTYFVEVDQAAARLDLSVGVLLTAVALKFATSAYLPQISYLTVIDKFVNASFVTLAFSTAQHAFVAALQDWAAWPLSALDLVNVTCFCLNAVLWACCQLYFVVSWRRATRLGTHAGHARVDMARDDYSTREEPAAPVANGGSQTASALPETPLPRPPGVLEPQDEEEYWHRSPTALSLSALSPALAAKFAPPTPGGAKKRGPSYSQLGLATHHRGGASARVAPSG